MSVTHERFHYPDDADGLELGFREIAWILAENMYGWGAWEEPGERLPA